ncbi:MAG: hypothetical protein ACREF8_05970 [Chthoniobacterales bacterium]
MILAFIALAAWLFYELWAELRAKGRRIEELVDAALRAQGKEIVFRPPTAKRPTESWFPFFGKPKPDEEKRA